MMNTLFPSQPTLVPDTKKSWQGRSKKKLVPVIEHDGRVWVAFYEGRGNRFFGSSQQEAHKNLQSGGA